MIKVRHVNWLESMLKVMIRKENRKMVSRASKLMKKEPVFTNIIKKGLYCSCRSFSSMHSETVLNIY